MSRFRVAPHSVSPSANPVPRRSLGGVQLPDGASGGDRALTVGEMPLSVLCSQFDCQRAPFDPSVGSRPWSEPQLRATAHSEERLRQPRRFELRALRHGRLSPKRRLALSAYRRRSTRRGRSFFDGPSTDVAASLRPTRPPPTPRTTRRLRKARTPSPPVPLSRQAVMRGPRTRQDESCFPGHDSSSPAVPGYPGPGLPGPRVLVTEARGCEPGCRSPLSRSSTAKAVRWFYPTRCNRERTRDGPNPSHEAGQLLSPVA